MFVGRERELKKLNEWKNIIFFPSPAIQKSAKKMRA